MNAIAYAHDRRDAAIDQLKEFLRIPSISTLSEYKADVQRAADWLAAELTRIGLENVTISPTKGHPVVYADWLHAEGKPTVLVYGHYDVQPADPLELWHTPPFEPTERDGKLFARGSADDKGQIYIHVQALEALLQSDGKLPVNVKIMFEGEEEIGSYHLAAWLAENERLIQADVVVISDSHILSEEQPAITYGLRGLSYIEVHVETSRDDLHSGAYGGAVHNPVVALAEIIAQLHDANGTVTIPGFYDDVRPLEDEERTDFTKIPFDESTLIAETGITQAWGEKEFTVIERLTARPTLELNGIWGGFAGEGAKTVLPARAGAKISTRLVPDQEPNAIAKLVGDYILSIAPPTVRLTIKELHHGPGAIVPRDIPAMVAASEAYEEIFGKRPIFMRGGGSIPVVALFQQRLGMDSVLMGFGLPDDNLHAPNEKFNLAMFHKGVETAIVFYQKMGR